MDLALMNFHDILTDSLHEGVNCSASKGPIEGKGCEREIERLTERREWESNHCQCLS